MAGIQSPDFQPGQTFYRCDELSTASPGKVVTAESPVGKHGVPADKELFPFMIQADTPLRVARRVHYNQFVSHPVSLAQEGIGNNTRRPGCEMAGKARVSIEESLCIAFMDSDASAREVRDIPEVRDVVKMAVREHNFANPMSEGLHCFRRHAGVDKDVPDNIRVPKEALSRNILDCHAQ